MEHGYHVCISLEDTRLRQQGPPLDLQWRTAATSAKGGGGGEGCRHFDTYVERHPMMLDSWPRAMAASRGGVPIAMDTERKAVYIAPMWAAPLANM